MPPPVSLSLPISVRQAYRGRNSSGYGVQKDPMPEGNLKAPNSWSFCGFRVLARFVRAARRERTDNMKINLRVSIERNMPLPLIGITSSVIETNRQSGAVFEKRYRVVPHPYR